MKRTSGKADVVGRHGGLFLRTLLVSALTLASRILGLVREMIAGSLFGDSSGIFDAFLTAWRVPNLFRRLLGEGAIATALQTELTAADADGGDEVGKSLFLATFALLAKILLGLCALVMLLGWLGLQAMPLDPGSAPGWWNLLGEDPREICEFTIRVMPFVILICLAAVSAGALQVRGHFATPAAGPIVLNVGWVLTLLLIAGGFGWRELGAEPDRVRELGMARWLTAGVLVAGFLQFLVLLPALKAQGLVGGERAARERRDQSRRGAWTVLKRSAPLALGAAVYQINVMIDGLMAEGLLANGGPTLHYFANRVQQFPLALVSIAATSAVFPSLAALGKTGRREELKSLHDRTQRAIAFVALPAGVGLAVLASPIFAALFEHGAFTAAGVERGASALRFLALAILPAGAVGLAARAYYSLGEMSYPVKVSSLMLLLNVGLNYLFAKGLGLDVAGLALATCLTSWATLAILLPGLRGRLGLPARAPGSLRAIGLMALAAAGCGLAAWGSQTLLAEELGRRWALILSIPVGITVYMGASQLLGIEEWRGTVAGVRRRLGAGPQSKA